MNHKFRIIISISAVSVFSLPALAGIAPGSKTAGTEQRATPLQSARVVGGLTLFEMDSQNADLAITARIREGITGLKNLSVSARNVKIITTDGRVVLMGAVNTAEEKRLIGDIAIGVRRSENVSNRLAVSASPSAPTSLRVVQ